jgi:putative PIG3 family NAD(P)H quinone oxidoreductase
VRAVVLERYGGPEVLALRDVPDLEPGPGEVRVAVHATALNRADLLQRLGRYPPPGPRPQLEIPGLEFAGTVDRAGAGVTAWTAGDRVFGLLAGGGYADQVVAHERMLMRVPEGMGFPEAAAIPEVFFTAWDALVDKGGLRPNDAVLVHAAGSGVGTAAVQLARLLGAGRVVATTRTREKAGRLGSLGADRAVVVPDEEFGAAVLAETGNRGADVILDFVGAPYLERNLAAAALEGRIVLVSYLGGPQASLPLAAMLSKRLRLVGTTLRSRPPEQKMALTQRFVREILPSFKPGGIRPVVDRAFRLDEIAAAHRYLEENRNFGKVVITVR